VCLTLQPRPRKQHPDGPTKPAAIADRPLVDASRFVPASTIRSLGARAPVNNRQAEATAALAVCQALQPCAYSQDFRCLCVIGTLPLLPLAAAGAPCPALNKRPGECGAGPHQCALNGCERTSTGGRRCGDWPARSPAPRRCPLRFMTRPAKGLPHTVCEPSRGLNRSRSGAYLSCEPRQPARATGQRLRCRWARLALRTQSPTASTSSPQTSPKSRRWPVL